jgi:hypothetical protein
VQISQSSEIHWSDLGLTVRDRSPDVIVDIFESDLDKRTNEDSVCAYSRIELDLVSKVIGLPPTAIRFSL